MSLKQMCFQISSHVETDQAQQLDRANCQAENSKLLGPQWRKHECRKCRDGRTDGRIPHWDTTPDCRHVAGVTWWTFSRPCPSTWLPDFLFSISLLASSTVHVYPIYHSKPHESLFFRDCQIQPRFYSVGSHDYFQSLLCLSICSIDLLDHNDRFLLYTCFTLGYH